MLCQVTSVVSDSVRPHRWQPTRLPGPWDSPGKNTGVGCHFLLQCMKVKRKVKSLSRVRLLATPWIAAYQAPPSMGFARQEYWSRLSLPSLCKCGACPQSFPASGSFPMSQLFASGGQSIRASASASVLPMSIQGCPLLYVTRMNSMSSWTSGTHSLMEERSGKCMISYMVSDKGQRKRTSAQDTVRIQERRFGLQWVKAQRVTLLCLESF